MVIIVIDSNYAKYSYLNNNPSMNSINYYIQYLSSWFYHNVLYTETAAVLLKVGVFVILLTLLVYEKYNYFIFGVVFAICVVLYLYLRVDGTTGAGAGMGMMDAGMGVMGSGQRLDKDELTIGVPLIKEGFSIGMPKLIKGDDSGKDYHRSNKFIEEDSHDFTEKYFSSKKCGIGSGIGGITMFGSNELLGGERKVVLSGLYDFSVNWGDSSITDTTPAIKSKRYKYFRDCVFVPVKRSVDGGGGDFREIKTAICDNINTNIININNILARFNTNILFNIQDPAAKSIADQTADYTQRISLSSNTEIGSTGLSGEYVSLINGATNNAKLKNIQALYDADNINDKMYAGLLTTINNNSTMNSAVKQRHLEIYEKAYGFRKKLDSIFMSMRTQTKDDASLMYTIRVNDSVIRELRMMLTYLTIIQRTNDIIQFETHVGVGKNGIYDMAPIGLPPVGELDVIPNIERYIDDDASKGTYFSKISGASNNIFKITVDDDTYNNNDEKRYVYGITYYFDKTNSKL